MTEFPSCGSPSRRTAAQQKQRAVGGAAAALLGGGGGGAPIMHLVSTRRRRRLPEGSGRLVEWHTVRALSRQSVLWGDCDHGGVDACSGKVPRTAREGLGETAPCPGRGLRLGRSRARFPPRPLAPADADFPPRYPRPPPARSLGPSASGSESGCPAIFPQKLLRGFLNCLWLCLRIFLLRAN